MIRYFVILTAGVLSACVAEPPSASDASPHLLGPPAATSTPPGSTGPASVLSRKFDASSCVVIDAPTERESAQAERQWLNEHFPGWRVRSQGLVFDGKSVATRREFDTFDVITPSGEMPGVCFDITRSYGVFKLPKPASDTGSAPG